MGKNYFSFSTKFVLLLLAGFLITGSALQAQTYVSSFPYNEDFEGFTLYSGSTCPTPHTLSNANGWENDTTDGGPASDWWPWKTSVGGFNSGGTGPTANGGPDHNPGLASGTFLMTETSCSGNGNAANTLWSPYLDLVGQPNFFMDFWHHSFGANCGNLFVAVVPFSGGVAGTPVVIDTIPPLNLDQWNFATEDLSAWAGDTVRVTITHVTVGTGFYGDLSLDDFTFYSIPQLDAGATAITAPTLPISAGANNVDVEITNFGADTLTSAMIGWDVNGLAQTPFAWTGSVSTFTSAAPANVGSFNFPSGFSTIRAWTMMPNGMTDSFPGNDTTELTVCTALKGTYTVGGVGADFVGIADMADALNNCGVDSAVYIWVNPGTYNDSMELNVIPGASMMNTVTIDGSDMSLVTITSGEATIDFDGTDWVTLKNMTIMNTATTDGYGIQLSDTSSHNSFDSLTIMMDNTPGLFDLVGISASGTETSTFTEGQNAEYCTFSNIWISGGEKGVHFEGQSLLRTNKNEFWWIHIDDVDDYGFYMDDQDSLVIYGCEISNLRNAGADAIYMFDIQNFNISYNTALDVPDWGIYISDGNYAPDGTPASRGKVWNNAISSQTDEAGYFDDVETTDFWHNTFASWGPGAAYGAYFNDVLGTDIRNNVFYSANSYSFYTPDASGPDTLDYNQYYSGGLDLAYQAGARTTLAAWTAAYPAYNANSVAGDPVFVGGSSDLHVLSAVGHDVGAVLPGMPITTDFEGQPRPQGAGYDMGADEYSIIFDDAAGVEIISPGPLECGDSATVITVVIRNLGQDTIFSLPITVDVTGDIPATLNTTYNDTLPFNNYDTVIVGTINTYLGGMVNMVGWVTLGGDTLPLNDTTSMISSQFIPHDPVGIDGYGCGTDSALISAVPYPGVQYQWFANQTDTVPLSIGNDFMVPSISTQSTYYVQYNSSQDSLTTTFAGGNGQQGNMFDIVALQTTQILSFAGSLNAGTHTVTIWTRNAPGSYSLDPNNANGSWVQVGQATGVVSAGAGGPTQVPIAVNFTIPAGQTQAFYFETSNGVDYTNGTTVGSVFAQNTYFQFLEGAGKGNNFGSLFQPRVWNGIIYFGSEGCSETRVPVSAVTGMAASLNLGGPATYCTNSPVTLDATTPGATSYNWSTGDSTATTSITSSGVYYADIVDSNGCAATDTATIVIFAPISVSIGADTLLCDGTAGSFDAGSGYAAYTWSNGGAFQTTTESAAGPLSVTVTDTNGCMAMDTLVISTANSPTVSYSVDTSQCPTIGFIDQSTDSPTTWSWDFGDGSGTSTQASPSYTYTANGSYTVTLTAGNICGTNSSNETVIITCVVAIDDELLGEQVSVYPNPNSGIFTVELADVAQGDYTIKVYNLYGQTVLTQDLNGVSGAVKQVVSIEDRASGIYFVEVSSGDRKVVHKLIVE